MYECQIEISPRHFKVLQDGFLSYAEACEWRDSQPNHSSIEVRAMPQSFHDY